MNLLYILLGVGLCCFALVYPWNYVETPAERAQRKRDKEKELQSRWL